jgi:hypothetical protein
MTTIRIDEDVYCWLRAQAVPFEDTPNSVLRRLAGLDKKSETAIQTNAGNEGANQMIKTDVRGRRITGKYLKELWKVDVIHALYHQDGTFYENLHMFPGALFDDNGYVVFKTEHDYSTCRYLDIGQKLNIHQGISSIPGYKRMR